MSGTNETYDAIPQMLSQAKQDVELNWNETFGNRPIICIHTRPMISSTVGAKLASNIIEITSVGGNGSEDGVFSIDSFADNNEGNPKGTPDFPFTEAAARMVSDLLKKYPNAVVVAPYVNYIDSIAWSNLVKSIRCNLSQTLIAGEIGDENDNSSLKYLEKKTNFIELLTESDVSRYLPRTIECKSNGNLDAQSQFISYGGWEKVRATFGDKFVVQVADSAGGSGTKLVGVEGQHTIEDAKKIINLSPDYFKIIEYIDGYETNGSAVVTTDGRVFVDPLTHKPVSDEIRKVFGGKKAGAIGDDLSQPWPEQIQKQYIEIMTAVGKVLSERGYKGIFGIDFIVKYEQTEERWILVPHEINPRPQGTTRIHALNAESHGRPSSWELHMLLFGGSKLDFMPDPHEYNNIVALESGGWQFDIVPNEEEVGSEVKEDINGTWSWNFETQELERDPSGDIIIVAPRPGQPLNWKDREGNKRLTSHGQIYYNPKSNSKVKLPAIFDFLEQKPTEFGKQISLSMRKLLFKV